jgi:leader peptidase (prepilin peptidase)/N-methyltransferase
MTGDLLRCIALPAGLHAGACVPFGLLPAVLRDTSAAAAGLIAGSFLTVVVHRLPIMLVRRWQRELRALGSPLSGAPAHASLPPEPYNLSVPRSRCPCCARPLKLWEITPVVGFLLVRAHCRTCRAPIDPAYPLLELVTAVLAVGLAHRYGIGAQGAGAFLLAAMLLALGLIDATTGLLPDVLTALLMWSGLLVNAGQVFVTPGDALLGAAGGYLALRALAYAFRRLTGKPGFAAGDFKLMGGLGAWLGWRMLPHIVLLASASGLVVGLLCARGDPARRPRAFAFGPFLALAALGCLLLPTPLFA